jgi:hypothetical protein
MVPHDRPPETQKEPTLYLGRPLLLAVSVRIGQ